MEQSEVIQFCNSLLSIQSFKDYCPNGLQVEGDKREVKKIITGVSISLELIEQAIDESADLILTHHGMIWDKDERVVRGVFRKRLHKLLSSGIATAAYHLPLDYHPTLGNNIQLCNKLGIIKTSAFPSEPNREVGLLGEIEETRLEDFTQKIELTLCRKPLLLPFGKNKFSKIALSTGGAQGYFQAAIDAGADCFITGEVSEYNQSLAKENGVHFISAGHYATEKFGIIALGEHIKRELGIDCNFIDIPNPV